MRSRSAVLLAAAAALAAPLLVSTPSAAAPAPQPRAIDSSCPAGQIHDDGFRDVPWANAHETAVDCAVHWQIATGTTSASYAPAQPVNRAQMASFIARLVERSGGTLPAASRDWFGDDTSSPHQDNINRLADAGIVGGKREGAFAPYDGVTRAQMAAFLTRAYDYRAAQAGQATLAAGEDYFTDDDSSSLQREINAAAAAGFAGGYGDASFRPGLTVPRDQMGAFLARALDLVVENGMADVPAGPRAVAATDWQPYATVGPVVLHAPGHVVELVGFHQSGHDGAQAQHAVGAARSVVLPSRSRGTHPQGAADLVVDPAREVRSPVTGTVKRAGNYQLYCRYPDQYLVVEPEARPGYEVKLLHVDGLQVSIGQRLEAGVTVVAAHARLFPFGSQIDDLTVAPHWPHVHVEVVDPSIPDRPSGGC